MEPNSPSKADAPSLLSAARSSSPTKRPFGSGHVSPVRSPQKSPPASSPIMQNNDLRSHFMTTTSVTTSPTKRAVQDADKTLSSVSGLSQEESAAVRSAATGGGFATFQKDAQGMMAAYGESAKDMMKSHVIDPAPIQTQPSGQSATNRTASSASSASSGKRDLDLKHNDNTFHVLADLVVSHFIDLNTSSDLDSIVPQSARKGFVEAVRYRLKYNCPPESEAQIHVLTRQCRELGLDREDASNPLFAGSAAAAAADATPGDLTVRLYVFFVVVNRRTTVGLSPNLFPSNYHRTTLPVAGLQSEIRRYIRQPSRFLRSTLLLGMTPA
jgi:hypothetical protein